MNFGKIKKAKTLKAKTPIVASKELKSSLTEYLNRVGMNLSNLEDFFNEAIIKTPVKIIQWNANSCSCKCLTADGQEVTISFLIANDYFMDDAPLTIYVEEDKVVKWYNVKWYINAFGERKTLIKAKGKKDPQGLWSSEFYKSKVFYYKEAENLSIWIECDKNDKDTNLLNLWDCSNFLEYYHPWLNDAVNDLYETIARILSGTFKITSLYPIKVEIAIGGKPHTFRV